MGKTTFTNTGPSTVSSISGGTKGTGAVQRETVHSFPHPGEQRAGVPAKSNDPKPGGGGGKTTHRNDSKG